MATKKFIIEVEEGRTGCDNFCLLKRCNGDCADIYEYVGEVIPFLRCSKYNLATIKITEYNEDVIREKMIEKASKFIHDTIFNWANDYDLDAGLTWNELRAKYIERFKQAMQDESK